MSVLSSGHTMQRGGHCNIYTPIPISYYQPIHCFSFHTVKFYLLLLTAHETISIRAKFKQIKTSSTAWQTQLAINDVCLLRFITAGKTVKCSVYESKWMKVWPTTLQAPDSALIFKFKQENRSRIRFTAAITVLGVLLLGNGSQILLAVSLCDSPMMKGPWVVAWPLTTSMQIIKYASYTKWLWSVRLSFLEVNNCTYAAVHSRKTF